MNLEVLRRAGARIAIALMALNAAWPLIAQARPFDPFGEICSARPARAGAGHGPAGLPGGGEACSHCALCSLAPHKVLAIPGSIPIIAALFWEAAAPLSAAGFVAPQESQLHSPSFPRAPPFPG